VTFAPQVPPLNWLNSKGCSAWRPEGQGWRIGGAKWQVSMKGSPVDRVIGLALALAAIVVQYAS
jgi:hypothetical protein